MNTLRFNPNYSSYDYEKTVIFKVWCQYHEWYSSSLQWYLITSRVQFSSVELFSTIFLNLGAVFNVHSVTVTCNNVIFINT